LHRRSVRYLKEIGLTESQLYLFQLGYYKWYLPFFKYCSLADYPLSIGIT